MTKVDRSAEQVLHFMYQSLSSLHNSSHELEVNLEEVCHNRFVLYFSQGQNNKRVLSMFGGTQEKCTACNKTVYLIEKV